MSYLSHFVSIQAMKAIYSLPSEIYLQIKQEVVSQTGTAFWDTFEKMVDIGGLIAYDATEAEAVAIIKRHLNIAIDGSTFSDSLVDFMGPGVCYLKAIPRIHRIEAFKELASFPPLWELLARYEDVIKPFFLVSRRQDGVLEYCHLTLNEPWIGREHVEFNAVCHECFANERIRGFRRDFGAQWHRYECRGWDTNICVNANDNDYDLRVGGFLDIFKGGSPGMKEDRRGSRSLKYSSKDSTPVSKDDHMSFGKVVKGDGREPDLSRDLFSVPKPEEVETMADHLNNHKPGDVFPYLAVMGNETESKDSRLARLRSFKSAYGKENKPEMKINGIVLDELEGVIQVERLRDYVDQTKLNRMQQRQNKKFKPITETSFKKPYLLISRITGEYVPMMSSSSDYTELCFTLEDGRLLEHQTIVQSNKIPSNQNGVFELSCDYCISVKDLPQLSLKYFLSRPIMREGFQWGAVSLNIQMSESDSPFLIPKVEAMATVRTPYTTLEEKQKDPDHADIVFTSGQVKTFVEMYKSGDIVDVDEPKRERTQRSSYSKSTLRGNISRGEKSAAHLSEMEGWEHLSSLRRPKLPVGEASVSAASGDDDEVDEFIPPISKQEYEAQQEKMRLQFEKENHEPLSSEQSEGPASSDSGKERVMTISNNNLKKQTRFNDHAIQLEPPDTKNVYNFN